MKECGTIKWYNSTKGFGFISRHNKPDLFFHITSLLKPKSFEPQEDQRVIYEIKKGQRGLPQAIDIELE